MTRQSTLLARLQSIPADFTWDELVTVLTGPGFQEKSDKGGSYRAFIDQSGRKLNLHAPHPQKLMKRYAIRKVIEQLDDYGLLPP